jgi:putative ABC transport system permease protein
MSTVETNVDHFLAAEKRKDLTMEDYQAVLAGCRHCQYVGAVLQGSARVKHGDQSIDDTTVQGITPSMATVLDTDLTSGRMLNETDMNNHSSVAVVGTDIVEHLMTGSDPLGQEIRIDGSIYQVIGVGKKKGKTLGQSADNYALIPITGFLKQYGSHNNSIAIWGKALTTGAPLEEAMDEARVSLRSDRHDSLGGEDSFEIETNASLLSIWSGLSNTFFMATIGIAGVSLRGS